MLTEFIDIFHPSVTDLEGNPLSNKKIDCINTLILKWLIFTVFSHNVIYLIYKVLYAQYEFSL